MRIPCPIATAGVAYLDKAHAVLGQASGQQQLPSEIVGLLHSNSVHVFDVLGFGREVNDSRRLQHHARRQFKGSRAAGDFALDCIIRAKLFVQFGKGLHFAITLPDAGTLRTQQIRNRHIARLERSCRVTRAQISARQLYR